MENNSQHIDPKYDFYTYFQETVNRVLLFFESKARWYQTTPLIEKLNGLPKYFGAADNEIAKHIPIWSIQKTYNRGKICYHVYKMLYLMLKDKDFLALSKYDQNILLWATLLHDISKRGKPKIKAGKDPSHPFRSAWQCLYYFNDNFKFVQLSKEDFEEWDRIFEPGYMMKDATEIQNHTIVPNVKEFLDKKLVNKNFEKEVIWYVMLHQSVPTLADHPHQALLEPVEEEIPKYFNKRTFGLFRILLRNDSFSYLMFSSKSKKRGYGSQIDKNIDKIMPYIKD